MMICTRSRYKRRPDHGLIRVTRFVGKRPVEYSLQLYNERNGLIHINKSIFPSFKAAEGYATLYGFSLACWTREQKKV